MKKAYFHIKKISTKITMGFIGFVINIFN